MPDSLLEPQSAADRLSTPSKTEEAPPTFARNVGLAGSVFFAVGVVLWLWNIAAYPYAADASGVKAPPASWLMIRIWLLFGSLALAYHAFRERDPKLRRFFGLFGLGLVSFGGLWIGFMLVGEGVRALGIGESLDGEVARQALGTARWIAAIAGGVFALTLAAFAIAPFLSACSAVEGESPVTPLNFVPRLVKYFKGDVQVLAVAFIALQALLLLAIALIYPTYRELLRDQFREFYGGNDLSLLLFGLLPIGVWSLGVGLLFVILQQQAEDELAWRESSISVVGWVGALMAVAAFAAGFGDLAKVPDLMMPYGLLLGLLGFGLLWTFLHHLPPEGDTAYRAAWWLRALGLALAVYALARSLYPLLAEELFDQEGLKPFLVPNGFLMVALGLLYAWLGHSYCGEGKLVTLINRELLSYFSSPIAYVVIGGMVVIAWIAFITWLSFLLQAFGETVQEPMILDYLFGLYPVIALVVAIPMLTMRLLSEENRTGTMEVLLTAPVDETQVVLSKFFGSWILFMLSWSVWFLFPLAYRALTPESFDYRPFLSFFVGMCLMAGGFLSMGLFFSSVTKNQIIAFLLGLAGMIVLLAPGLFVLNPRDLSPGMREFLQLVSFLHHQVEFGRGQVHLKFVVFYVTLTIFWLFLTIKVLESRKWK